jgi:hypothetical protein
MPIGIPELLVRDKMGIHYWTLSDKRMGFDGGFSESMYLSITIFVPIEGACSNA